MWCLSLTTFHPTPTHSSKRATRMAANSFLGNTGFGADNIAPRAIARLSSPSIQALIALFLCFEAVGDWCMAVNLVLIVLLPKPDGGIRPNGLFPTIIRIWMRARIWAARQWERLHDHLSLFALLTWEPKRRLGKKPSLLRPLTLVVSSMCKPSLTL